MPKDADEQAKIGEYYLVRKKYAKAADHFKLSLELNDQPGIIKRNLGIAYWHLGAKEEAGKLIESNWDNDIPEYLRAMQSVGLQKQAITKIFPLLAAKLSNEEDIGDLLDPIAKSFASEKEKADFFLKLANAGKDDALPAEKMIREGLIANEYRPQFYEKLLKPMSAEIYNYEFQEIVQRGYSQEDAEEIYDHEHSFPENISENLDKLSLLFSYLNDLIVSGNRGKAKKFLTKLEGFYQGKAPRDSELRLYHLQLFGGNWRKFVGIEVSETVTNPQEPSINRLNAALELLNKLNRQRKPISFGRFLRKNVGFGTI